MSFTTGGLVPWTIPPDWSSSVRESLAWRSDVMRANATGVSYHAGLRTAPARGFDFDIADEGQAWRLADALLHAHGGKDFQLPIWPDVQRLVGAVSAGATSIACDTAGLDFVDGGKALLWRGVNQWEVVSIDTVEPGSLALSEALSASWASGTRLYPLRLARVQDGAQEVVWGGNDKGRRSLRFDLREPCDWPAIAPAATYLGHPVLELRPNAGDDDGGRYGRLLETVDNGLVDPEIFDLAGVQLRGFDFAWRWHGRTERSAFRSLLYALRGNAVPIWAPSWKEDLRIVSPIGSAATAISVEWAGYTVFGAQAANRRDLRIELVDGTIYYRRVTGSSEAGGNETLQIASALGAAVDPGAIRSVSFMTLCTAADAAEIEHVTDSEGVANASLAFSAVVPDV